MKENVIQIEKWTKHANSIYLNTLNRITGIFENSQTSNKRLHNVLCLIWLFGRLRLLLINFLSLNGRLVQYLSSEKFW